ncbi:DUF928 domain-containing protein [Zarconia navalis]|nr:DUF928 domain-containing protein [Zarconia navalis]
MNLKDSWHLPTVASLGLGLTLAVVAGQPKTATAQSINLEKQASTQVTFESPAEPAPRNTTGASSRDGGACTQTSSAIHSTTASLSPSNESSASVTSLIPTNDRGLTTEKRPTLFVYLPRSSASEVFISMEDEYENYHYHTTLPISDAPGIFSFTVPETAPILAMGTNYKWSVSLICGDELDPGDPKVEGWIQRIEPDVALSAELETADPLEQAVLYAASGIWYDTLATLADLRLSHPDDSQLEVEWSELLKSVGLEEVAREPLAE